MRLSVFGMGYVGNVSAACFAADGHTVIGVDPNAVKVDLINQGASPIVEPGLAELVTDGVRSGRLRGTTDAGHAQADVDRRTYPGIEQIRLEIDLTIGDRDDVGGNVGRDVARLRLDDRQCRQRA